MSSRNEQVLRPANVTIISCDRKGCGTEVSTRTEAAGWKCIHDLNEGALQLLGLPAAGDTHLCPQHWAELADLFKPATSADPTPAPKAWGGAH